MVIEVGMGNEFRADRIGMHIPVVRAMEIRIPIRTMMDKSLLFKFVFHEISEKVEKKGGTAAENWPRIIVVN
jgi:hypothetical protein